MSYIILYYPITEHGVELCTRFNETNKYNINSQPHKGYVYPICNTPDVTIRSFTSFDEAAEFLLHRNNNNFQYVIAKIIV